MTTIRPNLLEGDVAPHIKRLSIPLAWGMMAMMLFSIFDTFFIARLGTTYLAGLAFTIPVVMIYMGVIFGLSVGTTSCLSRVYGEGDFEKLRQMSTDALSLTVLITVSAAIIGFLAIDPIFRLMGASDDILPIIHRYMSVWYVGMPFLGVLMICNSCIRALGDTKFPSIMMSCLSLIAVVIEPFFIFGIGPFPQLYMMGAAVGAVIAYYIICMISLYCLIFRKKVLSPKIFHSGIVASWKRILHVAVPSIISNQISPISGAVITWMAAGYGREAVAALGIANRIEGMSTLVFYAIGAGVSIFTGQNFGAGNYGRITEAGRFGTRYSLYWGAFIAVVLWFFGHEIPAFFDSNPAVIAYAAQYLHWVPISYGAMGAMVVANASLNAMGKPIPATALILLRAFVLYIPLAWYLQHLMGFNGIILALTITNFAVGILSYYWKRGVTP